MAQINIHLRPEFEKDLSRFMKLREIPTKSEAVRVAVHEGAERSVRSRKSRPDFRKWSGRALDAAVNPHPRFANDDDLWA